MDVFLNDGLYTTEAVSTHFLIVGLIKSIIGVSAYRARASYRLTAIGKESLRDSLEQLSCLRR